LTALRKRTYFVTNGHAGKKEREKERREKGEKIVCLKETVDLIGI